MADFLSELEEKLESNRKKNLYRELRPLSFDDQGQTIIMGQSLINLSNNDYLGLSQNPRIVEAAQSAISKWGTGAQASRLVTGNFELHEELEEELAKFKGTNEALVFPTGYQASLAVLSSLPKPEDVVFLDRYVHACLVEGAKLSGAKLRVFPHQDIAKLNELIKKEKALKPDVRCWIVIDGVYSMDGDIAPLDDLLKSAKEHDAVLVVDDAHGTGVIGKQGKGITEYFGIDAKEYEQHLIMVATMSKALGAQGGVVLCAKVVKEFLINHAKSFIYTTGLNPGSVAAALESVRLLQEDSSLVQKLQTRASKTHQKFKESGFDILETKTAIVPIILGDEKAVITCSAELKKQGILVSAIRPPTVPKGTSRLRLVTNALLSDSDFERAVDLAHKIRSEF